jgi:glycosyltransferase involved in cell wall biosynthesis
LLDIPDYRLTIAGSLLGGTMPRRLTEAARDPRCTIAVDVPDLTGLYASAAVFINPMIRGTSIKMKTVNAVENGLAVVTTAVGNEGAGFTDGLHLLVRDTPETFASAVRTLLWSGERRRSMAACAQQFLIENYRFEHNLLNRLAPDFQIRQENVSVKAATEVFGTIR